MKNKLKNNYKNNKNSIESIAISGMLLALIIMFNFIFDYFKFFAGFSVQFFLIFYAISIYLIPETKVAFIFFLVVPWILLFLGFNSIHFVQFLLEYIFSFYSFSLFFIYRLFSNKKINEKIKIVILTIIYFLCISLKFLFHFIAGFLYWTPNDVYGSLILNFWGVLLNGFLTTIVFAFVCPISISLIKKINLKQKRRY